MLKALIQRAHRSALLWSWLNTALRVGAAVIILPLAVRLIPRDELGLWYVFTALGAFSALLELGFAYTVSINTAYLWAGASAPRAMGLPTRAEDATSSPAHRLAPLVHTFVQFYRFVGLAIFFLLATAGSYWVWRQTSELEWAASLRIAWFVYALGFAVNFSGSIWSALLNGLDRVRETQQSQMTAALLGLSLSLIGLLLGWRAWALVLGQATTGFLTWTLVRRRFLRAIPELKATNPRTDWSLIRTLWPLAWRNGMGALAAFMVAQANTLLCSAFLDLRATASYGLSVQLIGTLSQVSGLWVGVKIPYIAQLRVAEGNRSVAPLFARRVTCFLITFAAGSIVLLVFGETALHLVRSQTPLLSTNLLILLLIVTLLGAHQGQYTALVATENRNPFVPFFFGAGIASVLLSALLTPRWNILGLIIAPGIAQACINNWWTVWRGIRGMDITVREFFHIWMNQWTRHPPP
ncbi:MAG: hypothetical protein M9935_09220 [Kiritimatiellae bacterium]|nr:hypothetical protein [Kiritimatiellia bacterium]